MHLKSIHNMLLPLLICLVYAGENRELKTTIEKEKLIETLQDSIPGLIEDALIPGLSIAVIRDGEMMWAGAFGVKNMETKDPVTDSTIFEAASLSKPVFSYAVMKLVERGELDLDEPLIGYVSDQYIEETFLKKPINDERFRSITARMVLTHSSGFPNWRGRDELAINFKPGEKYSYSGEGFGYLQSVVEQVTGLSLNEFMTSEVFDPLDMKHSSFIWHNRFQDLTSVPHDLMMIPLKKQQPQNGHAAASLHTTATDFAHFILALINHEGLQKSTIDSMLSKQITSRPMQSEHIFWGLGIGLEETDHGTAFWHWGDNFNYKCLFVALPEKKIGLIYFTNGYHGLAIRKNIVDLAIGGRHTLFEDGYLANYGNMEKSEVTFIRTIYQSGIDDGLSYYREIVDGGTHEQLISERSMNSIGYYYMRKQEYTTAIDIFKLNVQAYPEAWNVYDSLGEAYVENGNIDLAITNYQKSIDLNPDNENGAKILKKLIEQRH